MSFSQNGENVGTTFLWKFLSLHAFEGYFFYLFGPLFERNSCVHGRTKFVGSGAHGISRFVFSRMRSEGFPFMSGGLGVGLCWPTVALAFAAVRCRPSVSVVPGKPNPA